MFVVMIIFAERIGIPHNYAMVNKKCEESLQKEFKYDFTILDKHYWTKKVFYLRLIRFPVPLWVLSIYG